MTVTLPPELQAFVEEQVASGAAPDVNAVLAEAVRVLQLKRDEETKRAALKTDIQVGIDQLDAGQGVPGPFDARQMLEDLRRQRGQQCGT